MVIRLWYDPAAMDEIAISKFKATCLAVLHEVQRTGKPVRVTKFGKPVAEVVPVRPAKARKRVLGAMRGTGEILGDIVAPAAPPEIWEAIGGRPSGRRARR